MDDARARFVRLCAAGGLAYCSYAICRSPLLPLFARDLGAGPELVGIVAAASTLTGIVVKLPAGALSDVFGRRTLLVAGGIVFAVLPFTYLPVAALTALVLVRFVHGMATAIFGPVASAALSDLAPAGRRGAWLGLYASLQGAGQAFGPVVAGFLMAAGGYDHAFVASGLLGVLALALVVRWPRTTTRAPRRHIVRELRPGIAEVARDARILTTSLAQAGQFLLNGTVTAFLPLYAREVVGLAPAQIGLVFGAQTAATLLLRPLCGQLSDRVGRRPVITAGLATSGLALIGVSVAGDVFSVLVAAVGYGTGLAVTTGATSTLITDLAPRARYGAAHGIFGTIYDVGDAFGPIAAGFVVAAFGYRGMFRAFAAVALLLAVLFAALSRRWAQELGSRGAAEELA